MREGISSPPSTLLDDRGNQLGKYDTEAEAAEAAKSFGPGQYIIQRPAAVVIVEASRG